MTSGPDEGIEAGLAELRKLQAQARLAVREAQRAKAELAARIAAERARLSEEAAAAEALARRRQQQLARVRAARPAPRPPAPPPPTVVVRRRSGVPAGLPVVVGVALLGGLVVLAQHQTTSQSTTSAAIDPSVIAAPLPSPEAAAPTSPTTRRPVAAPVNPLVVPHLAPSPSPRPRSSPARTSPSPHPSPTPSPAALTVAAPPAVTKPHLGRYSYAISQDGGDDQAATVAVSDQGGGSLGEATYTASDSSQEVRSWAADAVRLTSSTAGGRTCQWSPASVWVPAQITPTSTWDMDGTCTIPIDAKGHTAQLHEVAGARVRTSGWVQISGRSLFVWAIERSGTMTETVQGSDATGTAVSSLDSVDLFAPAIGMVVQTTQQTSTPDSTGQAVQTYTITRMLDSTPH